ARKPFALAAGRGPDKAGENFPRRLARALLRDGTEPREGGAALVRAHAVAGVGLVDQARREQDLLTDGVDLVIARPGTSTGLGVAKGLGLLAARSHRPHGPLLVRPDRIDAQQVDKLVEALGAVESAQARRGPVEVPAQVLVRTQRHDRDADELVRPCGGDLLRRAQ